MAKSEQINELALALSKVQGEIEGAIKDANNPFFKSKYADLTSCWQACREQLSRNGIAVVQSGDDSDTHLCLTTTLMHSSGQWIDGTHRMEKKITEKDKTRRDMNAQDIGAAITYLRRFSLCSLVGICPEDEDANSITPTAQRKDVHHTQQQTCSAMTQYQVLEIEQLLTQCTPEFVKAHDAFLKNTLRVDSMNLVDSRYYHEFKSHALANIATTKAKTVTLDDKTSPSEFDVKSAASSDAELLLKKANALKELQKNKIEKAFG